MNAVGGEESLTAKWLGFFEDLVPNIERLGMIGVVWDPQALQGVLSHQEETSLQEVSIRLGFRFENYAIKTPDDLERVLAKALSEGVRFAQRSLALRPAHSRCHQFVTR
jgi:hypothetical protein